MRLGPSRRSGRRDSARSGRLAVGSGVGVGAGLGVGVGAGSGSEPALRAAWASASLPVPSVEVWVWPSLLVLASRRRSVAASHAGPSGGRATGPVAVGSVGSAGPSTVGVPSAPGLGAPVPAAPPTLEEPAGELVGSIALSTPPAPNGFPRTSAKSAAATTATADADGNATSLPAHRRGRAGDGGGRLGAAPRPRLQVRAAHAAGSSAHGAGSSGHATGSSAAGPSPLSALAASTPAASASECMLRRACRRERDPALRTALGGLRPARAAGEEVTGWAMAEPDPTARSWRRRPTCRSVHRRAGAPRLGAWHPVRQDSRLPRYWGSVTSDGLDGPGQPPFPLPTSHDLVWPTRRQKPRPAPEGAASMLSR